MQGSGKGSEACGQGCEAARLANRQGWWGLRNGQVGPLGWTFQQTGHGQACSCPHLSIACRLIPEETQQSVLTRHD